MESVKLNIINGLLWGLKKVTLKLLFYQAKYQTDEAVNEITKNSSTKFQILNEPYDPSSALLPRRDLMKTSFSKRA